MPYFHAAARLARIAALSSLIAASAAHGGAFGVAPIRLELDRATRTSLITVTSDDARKLYFQAKLFEWTQDPQGKDVLAESADLVFFPQIFTLDPKQKRVIRVGSKGPAPAKEKAYRLFIEEMPDPNEGPAAGAQVAVRLRFGVPIFHWDGSPQPKLEAQARPGKGEAILTVRNDGDRNIRLEELFVLQGDRVLAKAAGWYVFPGVSREFSLPFPREACPISGPLRLRAVGEGREVNVGLESATGLCPA